MARIILASKSLARQKVLRQIGLKFTVFSSKAKESRLSRSNCSRLVISNARLKAEDAAGRFNKGIIIAADTVVLAKGKIIGKPKNLKDAARTLKFLCHNPHWVYTGLAVVDIAGSRVLTTYDKTKVYMCALSDEDIEKYCRKFSPLDKAGSFDIQGPGAAFIDRIEGCFYNVVGLPLAKLIALLKRLEVDIF
ncbi:MAG: Maf family protein [Candidatus Omnitrophota bacterium]|jgi:septum formation protein